MKTKNKIKAIKALASVIKAVDSFGSASAVSKAATNKTIELMNSLTIETK